MEWQRRNLQYYSEFPNLLVGQGIVDTIISNIEGISNTPHSVESQRQMEYGIEIGILKRYIKCLYTIRIQVA